MDELFPASLAMIQASVNQNNAFSAEQASKQMQFQREMSNSAHQREIADLKAAGLNPVLSAKLGGASTPSGSAASADTSGTSAIATLASEMMRQVASGFASGAFGAGYSSREGNTGQSALSDIGTTIFDPVSGSWQPFDIRSGIQAARIPYSKTGAKTVSTALRGLGSLISKVNPVAGAAIISTAAPTGSALYELTTHYANKRTGSSKSFTAGSTSNSAASAYKGSGGYSKADARAARTKVQSIIQSEIAKSQPYR